MSRIATFAFIDLETTGLPWQEKNQTKIIEFCIVAASRQGIEAAALGQLPPISKLAFAANPLRPIHPEVQAMTGFTNESVVHAPLFRHKIKSINTFLEELPKPVCLVAHNGNNFDYKILLAELIDAGGCLPSDILCVDSLVGFRKLLKGTSIDYQYLQGKAPTSSINGGYYYGDDQLMTDDEDDWPDVKISRDEWQTIDAICESLSDLSSELEESQQECKRSKKKVPERGKLSQKKLQEKRTKALNNIFRNEESKPKPRAVDKECFTLAALYKRLLDKEEPNAHRAEVDSLMLAECVVALKDGFLPWADGAARLLTDIQPLVRYT